MERDSFKEYILEQLAELGEVEERRMFGSWGLYCCGAFFGIISKGRLYFKTNETTRRAYETAGMRPFSPSAKQVLKNYYEVPDEVIEDRETLAAWARKAVLLAEKGKKSVHC